MVKKAAVLDDLAIATDFLLTSKSAVRNLAVAITETATPEVKKVLRRELDIAIDTHDKIAQYMIENEMYHAYDLNEQINHDLEKADYALKLTSDLKTSTKKGAARKKTAKRSTKKK